MVTPFCEDKSVDYGTFAKLINHLIKGGVDFLVVMGTTAESATLSQKEKDEILKFAKRK